MFVVRSKTGMVFTSTALGEENGKEVKYETKRQAEREMKMYEETFENQGFYIEKIKAVGRPAIGTTKKVSLTLSEENWEWLDEKANGNRSNFLREVVWNALGNESEWSNYGCLGYAILGAKKIGYNDEQIKELVRAIYGEFDWHSVQKAEEVYRESDY